MECDAARTSGTQALNNWGLALQQVATLCLSQEDKTARLEAAVGRFREAIRRDPGFHRAVYNLGTIMYALSEQAGRRRKAAGTGSVAGTAAATAAGPGSGSGTAAVASSGGATGSAGGGGGASTQSSHRQSVQSQSAAELQTAAALYICCARASDSRPVYVSSLRLVRHTLPLPALAAGSLLVAPPKLPVAPSSCWRRRWFMLDHEAFWTGAGESSEGGGPAGTGGGGVGRWGGSGGSGDVGGAGLGALGVWASVPRPRAHRGLADAPEDAATSGAASGAGAGGEGPWGFHIHMEEVATVAPCADASLPSPGYGFFVGLKSGRGHFFVAPSEAARESWVDALTLVQAIASRGRGARLQAELTAPHK